MNSIDCTIGKEAYHSIGEVCSLFGNSIAIINDACANNNVVEKIESYCPDMVVNKSFQLSEKCTSSSINALRKNKNLAHSDLILACGGEIALNTGKCIADLLGKKILLLPTVAVSQACCNDVALKTNEFGNLQDVYIMRKPVIHTFIDIPVLANAPIEYLHCAICEVFLSYYRAKKACLATEEAMAARECLKYMAKKLERIAPAACNANRGKRTSDYLESALQTVMVNVREAYSALYHDKGYLNYYDISDVIWIFLKDKLLQDENRLLQAKNVIQSAMLLYEGNINEFYRFSRFCVSIGSRTRLSELDLPITLAESIAESIVTDEKMSEKFPSYNRNRMAKCFKMLER